jgi:isopentenyl diphosphate isomerase/L-lactate dehydrogenase-like FMN-dependent dehydrogenase
MFPYVFQFLTRPRWLVSYLLDGGLMKFPNIVLKDGPMAYADVGAALEQSMVSWDDFQWIGDAWQGPIVVKGVHTADDARQAIDHGASAVVVSNHGGRQLDGVTSGIGALPEVVDAVAGRIPVLVDGGIRRGADVLKALALGADAVMVARPTAWGLAVAGEEGVIDVLRILRDELENAMWLAGCGSIAGIARGSVAPAP